MAGTWLDRPSEGDGVKHMVDYIPTRRALLGGGNCGQVVCSCGWNHPALAPAVASKLIRLHLEGEL